ncbi:hypothetical protein AAEX28_11810 [Lentisphaerota bacterium WC36G]|nr:hypothetical protein LJT99_14645 [Lentisphaerae bacterium WC36]
MKKLFIVIFIIWIPILSIKLFLTSSSNTTKKEFNINNSLKTLNFEKNNILFSILLPPKSNFTFKDKNNDIPTLNTFNKKRIILDLIDKKNKLQGRFSIHKLNNPNENIAKNYVKYIALCYGNEDNILTLSSNINGYYVVNNNKKASNAFFVFASMVT